MSNRLAGKAFRRESVPPLHEVLSASRCICYCSQPHLMVLTEFERADPWRGAESPPFHRHDQGDRQTRDYYIVRLGVGSRSTRIASCTVPRQSLLGRCAGAHLVSRRRRERCRSVLDGAIGNRTLCLGAHGKVPRSGERRVSNCARNGRL